MDPFNEIQTELVKAQGNGQLTPVERSQLLTTLRAMNYRRKTLQTYLSAWRRWAEYCKALDQDLLTTDPQAICTFVAAFNPDPDRAMQLAIEDDATGAAQRDALERELESMRDAAPKPTTMRLWVTAIGRLHALCERLDPTKADVVKAALRNYTNTLKRPPRAAEPMSLKHVNMMIEAIDAELTRVHTIKNPYENQRARINLVRDRCVIPVMYDTMCRRSDLVGMRIRDIKQINEMTMIDIPESKTNRSGEDDVRPLRDRTVDLLEEWLKLRESTDPFDRLFVSVKGGPYSTNLGTRMHPNQVTLIFQRAAARAGIDLDRSFSSHSTRGGAAIDQAMARVDLNDIRLRGGWKTLAMPAHYTRNISRAHVARRTIEATDRAMNDADTD